MVNQESQKPAEPAEKVAKKIDAKEASKEKAPDSTKNKEKKQEQFTAAKKNLEQKRGEYSEKKKTDKDIGKEFDKADPKPEKKDKKTEKPNGSIKDAEKATEQAEQEALKALKEKHTAEMQDVLEHIDIDGLDTQNRGSIHIASIAGRIPKEKIDTLSKEVKEKALKGLTGPDGKDIDVSKPLTAEQADVVRLHMASEYVRALSNFSSTDLKDTKKLTELEKTNPGITEFIKGQPAELLVQKTFFEAAKKDPKLLENFVHLVQENGMLMTGITPTSQLGKELVKVIEANVAEYQAIHKSAEGLIDIEHFKGLKDILGGSYMDLICSRDFILGDKHDLKKSRDAMMTLFQDSVALKKIPDPKTATPEEMAEFRKSIKDEFQKATGVDGSKVETSIQHISRSQLSPFIRFLADIFAPFGAMFPGKAGDFWREYLKNQEGAHSDEKYGEGRTTPIEGKGVENASSSAIYEAAKKYMGKNESNSPDLIRQMHAAAGLNAGPGTPWCMSFVQYILRHDMGFNSSQIGSPTASAADGHKIGRHTDTPKQGDIVLIYRSGGSGRHIGFVDKVNSDGSVDILGGNQSNSVCISHNVSRDKVAEYRTLEQGTTASAGGNNKIGNLANSGNEAFPSTPIGPDAYPSKDFLAKSGKSPESVPMGMRVNNPLNIKFTGSPLQRKLFEGVVGQSVHTDQGNPQIAFSTPEAGMISGIRLLLYKQKEHGLNTIQSMIADTSVGWTQDNTAANTMGNNAAREIAQRMGVSPTSPLDLSNPDTRKQFVKELIFQEQGSAGNIYASVLESSNAKV